MRDFRAYRAGSGNLFLERVECAVSWWERFRGLMLCSELAPDEGLLIPHCRSVHTCLMRFPIDVVYLSRDNEVVRIVDSMSPWRISFCLEACSVLEVGGGTAGEHGLREGDTVLFDFAEESAQAPEAKEVSAV